MEKQIQKKKKKKDDGDSFLGKVFEEFIGSYIVEKILHVLLFIPRLIVHLCRFIFD